MNRAFSLLLGSTVAVALGLGASVAQASLMFNVSLGTSQLSMLYPGASFALDFQLNDGTGTGDGNNTVTISNFLFGGGSPSGVPDLFGGASGSLAGNVLITDTDFLNELLQGFTFSTSSSKALLQAAH